LPNKLTGVGQTCIITTMIKDITDSEYFFHGSAYSMHDGGPVMQFGLYEPITSRFVLVGRAEKELLTVANLFSGRLALELCDLTTADNFNPTLVDNSCCLNWTIADTSELISAKGVNNHIAHPAIRVPHLGPATEIDTSELIVQNQEYLMAAYEWMCLDYRDFFQFNVDSFWKTELRIRHDIELVYDVSAGAVAINKIKNIIYNEWDFDIARTLVNEIYNQGKL